jgi:hypothetical protein
VGISINSYTATNLHFVLKFIARRIDSLTGREPIMNTPVSSASSLPWEFPIVPRELVTQEWCALHRLIEDLSAVQSRLGTPLEQGNDYEQVRDLGHKIRNKLHLVQLWAELGMIERSDVLMELTAS